MRITLSFCVLFCLALVGYGIHLVLEQQRQLMSFSATTTAIVLKKHVERHENRNPSSGSERYSYEPVVAFRFEARGHTFTSNSVFPSPFRLGGNLGEDFVRATVNRFEVGRGTRAYYNPDNPAEACLIRRPSLFLYLVILGPVIVVAVVGCFWPSPQAGGVEFKRRKARWIAALWHVVGLAAVGHYFNLAGADYWVGALGLFGLYTQLGLIPVAVALPASESSEVARRAKSSIMLSIVGTCGGFFLGLLIGLLGGLIGWLGYSVAIGAMLGAVLGQLTHGADTSDTSQSELEEESPPDWTGRAEPPEESDHFVSLPPPPAPIPYQIDQRPMPPGKQVETLLPAHVGPFRRQSIEEPDELSNPIYAQYRSDSGEIFVELGICGDPASAQQGVKTSKAETDAEFPDPAQLFSLKTEPSFFKSNTPRGAFLSWTRGGYYFSAHAGSGEEDLDRFMEAFPY